MVIQWIITLVFLIIPQDASTIINTFAFRNSQISQNVNYVLNKLFMNFTSVGELLRIHRYLTLTKFIYKSLVKVSFLFPQMSKLILKKTPRKKIPETM